MSRAASMTIHGDTEHSHIFKLALVRKAGADSEYQTQARSTSTNTPAIKFRCILCLEVQWVPWIIAVIYGWVIEDYRDTVEVTPTEGIL